jgi:hypothetical protein
MRRLAMKAAILVMCLSVVFVSPASADLDSLWMRTFGGAYNDGFRSVTPTSDGGFVAVGYTYSYGPDDVNVFAVKTDADGDSVWMRTFGGDGRDYAYGVCETGDGSYVITGYTTSFGSGLEDVYVLKVDASGDTVWTRTYGGPKPDEGRGLCVTSDGYILVVGRTESYTDDFIDLYLLKINAGGDSIWTRTLDDNDYNWAESVCELGDGNYAVCGATGSPVATAANLQTWVAKFAPDGNRIWDYGYGDDGAINPDWGQEICAVADTELVATGRLAIEIKEPLGPFFLRADLDGNQTAYRRYKRTINDPYYDCANSFALIPEGGYLLCGAKKDNSTHNNDLMLLKRVHGGGWAFEQVIGGAGTDWGSSIAAVNPGDYIVAGHTTSYGAGGCDAWLLSMKEPNAGAAEIAGDAPRLFLAGPAPNPFAAGTEIRFMIPRAMEVDLAVYDIAGRRVAVLASGIHPAGEHTAAWDGWDHDSSEVSPGIYVVRLVAGDVSTSRKLVLLK